LLELIQIYEQKCKKAEKGYTSSCIIRNELLNISL